MAIRITFCFISFVFIFLMFSCAPRKSATASVKDTTQLEGVQVYVEVPRPTVNRDTILVECLNSDCSEGIRRFYIKGNLNGESYFKDNDNVLVNKTYYQNNGPLATVDTLIHFKMVGTSVIYYSNGQLQRITHRDENGVEIGPYQSYYENGQKKLTVLFVNGKRNGGMIEYFQDGKIMQRGEFRDDKRHGEWRVYDAYGNVQEEKKYDNGVEIR